jgi:hypothetical protein
MPSITTRRATCPWPAAPIRKPPCRSM